MTIRAPLSRRDLLRHGSAVGVATLASGPAVAASPMDERKAPPAGEFVIRNAEILSMDPAIGDFPKGDIHIRHGEIVAVGPSVAASKVAEIDGAGMICMPGMVDTHQHMWTTPFRGLVNETEETSYGNAKPILGKVGTPDDTYAAHRLAMTANLYAGTTTSNNMNHNARGPDYSDAVLRAMVDTGQRGRFSYGHYDGLAPSEKVNFDDIGRIHKLTQNGLGGGLISIGLFPRGQSAQFPGVFEDEIKLAKAMGLPIAIDGASDKAIQALSGLGALGPTTLLVHCSHVSPAGRKAMAASGTAFSDAPWSEMGATLGMPVLYDMYTDGVLVTLSIDTVASPNESSMFGIARLAADLAHVLSKDQFAFHHKTAIEFATINGAKALGLADKIGSLTPGKRADVILVRKFSLNSNPAPGLNPYRLLVSTQAEDVDTVIVDGKVVKFGGRMTHLDVPKIIQAAADSLTAMRQRAHWP